MWVSISLTGLQIWRRRVIIDYGKLYILDQRIHHGKLGAEFFKYGIIHNNKYMRELGRILMLDDLQDLRKWHNYAD